MINLRDRSYQKELLDQDDIPFADIKQNMKELNIVNRLLGGHKISIEGLGQIIGQYKTNTTLSVCEIGCGGGDNLKAIADWCNKKKVNAGFTGIDIKNSCIEYAMQQYPGLPAKWITNDYAEVNLTANKPDVIFSSLFCHHFRNEELVSMLNWMKTNSSKGFFINDLQRHTLAYYLIKWITRFFSKSYLVKNDAPLSVARGFKKQEWEKIFEAAKLTNYSIQWKWAFRYLIVCKNES